MIQQLIRSLAVFLLLTASIQSIAQTSSESAESKKNSKGSANNGFVINGVSLDKAKFDQMLVDRLRSGQQDSKQLREAIAIELLNRELLVQEAKKKGMNRTAETRVRIDLLTDRLLADQYATQYLAEHPIAESAIKKEYENLLVRAGSQEVLLRQILVPSVEDAKGVLARLNAGEKFEEVAAKVSRDGSSRQQGGLISWTPVGFLEPKIGEAVKSLSKGGVYKEPIATVYGWHILKLEDTRAYTKPSFESVRAQVLLNMQQKLLDEHLTNLQSRAKKN